MSTVVELGTVNNFSWNSIGTIQIEVFIGFSLFIFVLLCRVKPAKCNDDIVTFTSTELMERWWDVYVEAIIGVSTFIFVLLSFIKPAKCNDDIVAEKMEGNWENSELYVIGENMYLKERKYKDFYLNVFWSRFVINLCSFEVQPKVFWPKFDKKYIPIIIRWSWLLRPQFEDLILWIENSYPSSLIIVWSPCPINFHDLIRVPRFWASCAFVAVCIRLEASLSWIRGRLLTPPPPPPPRGTTA